MRDGKGSRSVTGTYNWALLARRSDKVAVVDPRRLDKLELPPQVRSDAAEHEASVDAVVLHDSLGQRRPIARTTPQNAVQADHGRSAFERVAGVRAPNMRT